MPTPKCVWIILSTPHIFRMGALRYYFWLSLTNILWWWSHSKLSVTVPFIPKECRILGGTVDLCCFSIRWWDSYSMVGWSIIALKSWDWRQLKLMFTNMTMIRFSIYPSYPLQGIMDAYSIISHIIITFLFRFLINIRFLFLYDYI